MHTCGSTSLPSLLRPFEEKGGAMCVYGRHSCTQLCPRRAAQRSVQRPLGSARSCPARLPAAAEDNGRAREQRAWLREPPPGRRW